MATIETVLMVALLIKSKNFLNFTFLIGNPNACDSPPYIANNKNNGFIVRRLVTLGCFIGKAPRLVTKKSSILI